MPGRLRSTALGRSRSSRRSTTAHQALYGYHFRGKADQHVEWVNLG